MLSSRGSLSLIDEVVEVGEALIKAGLLLDHLMTHASLVSKGKLRNSTKVAHCSYTKMKTRLRMEILFMTCLTWVSTSTDWSKSGSAAVPRK